MTDTELIEELRWALDEETTGVWAGEDLARQAKSGARRRRTLRGLLAAVPAAGVAAGLLLTSLPARTPPPSPEHAAYVTSKVEAALTRTSDYIMRTTFQPSADATTVTWLDSVTGDTRQMTSAPAGQLITWTRTLTRNTRVVRQQTTVDEANRTWWTVVLPVTAPATKAPPAAASPTLMMQALEQGQVTVAGQQQVDGKTALVLRLIAEKATAQLWVDRSTYRPLRIILATSTTPATLNLSWLPRTPTTLTTLNTPRVPPSYTQVTAPSP